jgi:hypothetical protein
MEYLNIGTKVRVNGGIFYGVIGVIVDFNYGSGLPCIVKYTLPDGDVVGAFSCYELEVV